MEIKIYDITAGNREVAEAMRVAPGQELLIETVSACLAEADENSVWNPVVVKVAEDYAAFAMYGLWKDEGSSGRVWLDRFLIDRKFQGRGYSKPVLQALMEHIKAQYGYKELFLSVYETNLVAISLYEKLGFRFNGDLDINGEKIMMANGQ